MENNTTYNLLNQLTQESKSLWRIKKVYEQEAESEAHKTFWKNLAMQKEESIAQLKLLIKENL